MPTYTIKEAVSSAKGEGKSGPWERFNVILSENGTDQVTASWFSNRFKPAPKVGERVDCTVKQGQYGLEVELPRSGGGGGQRGPSHPQDAARMLRCHSEEMALRFMDIAYRAGQLPADQVTRDTLRKLADWFDADVKGAM